MVTDGNERATLAVVRALGREGIPVTVGSPGHASMAGCSRYCSKKVCYPSPVENARMFQSFLRDELQKGPYQVLLPMTDITMQLVAQMPREDMPHVTVPFPSEEEINRVQNKHEVLQIAQRLGIPCPRSYWLAEHQTIDELAQTLHYPVVIKPRYSRFWVNGEWIKGGVRYARDPEDLKGQYKECHTKIPFPLIQEKIQGEGRGVFVLLWNGDVKAAFSHRRLREKPPWGGVSVYSESARLDDDLLQQSVSLLRALGWQGVAMVEYKVDRQDGKAKLMEVNGRFWGSLQLAIDAGVNFPLLLYRLAVGEAVGKQFSYRTGVKSRWLLGDLDHLLIRLTHSGPFNGLPDPRVSSARACLNFLKLYEPGLHYDVLRLNDLRPAWFECKAYLRETWRKLRARTGTSPA
jgi:predicted ATP-grasp superfamily ATP-dependent carboligase